MAEQALGSLSGRFLLRLCPNERPAPRKDWIAEDTWPLLQRHARKGFFAWGRLRRRHRLRCFFLLWRSASRPGAGPWAALVALALLAGEADADGAVRQAFCGGVLRRASGAAAQGVKRDRSAWLRGRADSIAAQANAGSKVHSET